MYAPKKWMKGSPPRVRGKAEAFKALLVAAGITPACAGKRMVLAVLDRSIRDHPRVCGEKEDALPVLPTDSGSPPRVRGKGQELYCLRCTPGITPACAGKRCSVRLSTFHLRDHPRVCGEKHADLSGNGQRIGSPPRVRGKAEGKAEIARTLRITPACAGKSNHIH